MKILIAMNSFKGSLSAIEATDVVEKAALELKFKKSDLYKIPMVDGGTDSLEAWSELLDLKPIKAETLDPLGNPITTTYLYDQNNKNAYIEMAKASGVHLVDPSPKTIFEANSFGTGVLIQEAIKKGAKDIFLGIGGSATHDLGTGILRSLGVKFYDDKGNILESPQELFRLDSIDFSSLENLPQDLHITFLCDVNNKLLGENGAAYTYAKQKGAETKALIEKCEELSKVFYKYFQENLGIEIGNRAGDGAAGGLPSIIRVLINAELKSGASFIFDIANIDSLISKVSIVITGEGSFDQQSYYGKGPGLLLERAKLEDIYSIALCGKISPQVYRESNRNISFFSINNSSESLSEAIINTKNNLYVCSKNILSVLKLGLKQKKQLN